MTAERFVTTLLTGATHYFTDVELLTYHADCCNAFADATEAPELDDEQRETAGAVLAALFSFASYDANENRDEQRTLAALRSLVK